MIIRSNKRFEKMYDKLDKKEQLSVRNALAIFADDPFSPSLRNHELKGRYNGYRSINAKGDLRIVFEEKGGKYELVFLTHVGSHSQLYG